MGCSGLWAVGCGRAVGCGLLAVGCWLWLWLLLLVVVVAVLFLFWFFSCFCLLWFLFIHVVFVGHGWFSLVGGRGGWLVPDVFFGCLLIGRGRFLIYLDFRFAFSSSIGVTFSRFERWVVLCCLLVVPDLFVA